MSEEAPEYGTEDMKEKERVSVSLNFNRVILGGRLTADPEIRYTPGGAAVCNFSLASNEVRKDKEGNTHEKVIFIECVSWQKLAEICAKFLRKGSPVLVEGKLELDSWENKEGEKRSRIKLRCSEVHFLERKSIAAPDADEPEEKDVPF